MNRTLIASATCILGFVATAEAQSSRLLAECPINSSAGSGRVDHAPCTWRSSLTSATWAAWFVAQQGFSGVKFHVAKFNTTNPANPRTDWHTVDLDGVAQTDGSVLYVGCDETLSVLQDYNADYFTATYANGMSIQHVNGGPSSTCPR